MKGKITRIAKNFLIDYVTYPILRYKYPILPQEYNRAFYIPISSIKKKIRKRPNFYGIENTHIGGVCGGDWDLDTYSFPEDMEENLKYKCIHDHFIHKIPWEETELFQTYYDNRLRNERVVRGCLDLRELAEFYKQYDLLYEDIKKNGFKVSKHEFDIPVYIGREGDYIYTRNGNHRFFMAKLLGFESIPVKVYIRHKLWYEKLEKANRNIINPEFILNHPDRVLLKKAKFKIE
jgi:hypothetical protein